ncbi:hypothetical protein [Hyalangium minutum]|uniref:Cytochrome c domain-containing protein n=1 Tax=Hyalangium minutum TaxID=394096 RepID=A0A085WRA5_9BACT|nr:hypothetical protein [Hyalangium minutum]KFE70218.1 hypothetical protein DB31_5260 [Hyalangium minutum]
MRIVRKGTEVLGPWLCIGALAALAACAPPEPEEPEELGTLRQSEKQNTPIDPARELFITDVKVVDDTRYTAWPSRKNTESEGAWSFGQLIDDMLPDWLRTPYGRSQFILRWLKSWEQSETVNGQVIPARPLIRSVIIDPWRTASGCRGPDDSCVLDMARAPFRLLAIVNRPDLRQVASNTSAGLGGQGRFIFGALGAQGQKLPFTIIFEYELPVSEKVTTLTWAQRWHQLGSQPFGERYNSKLVKVTREFTKWNAAPRRVNGSALLQIRTNEVPLSPVTPGLWEMREFVLSQSGFLRTTTVKQEVNAELNGTTTLGTWVSSNARDILAGQHEVPRTWQGRDFLAAAAPVPEDLAWSVPGVSEQVRKAFAQATCSGCHKSETGTNFLHVRLREVGSASQLSAFLAQELSSSGPRVADFQTLLNIRDLAQVRNGKGRDHGTAKDSKDD